MDAIATIDQGQLRGVARDGSLAFLGIPFAEAPVGELRFAAPAPARGWDGVRDATVYGPTPQRRPFGEVTTIPEPSIPGLATLSVNVFTPALPSEGADLLPVFVWIHGGGYKAGSAASPWYNGAAFNRDGVVTVTLSYRLGFEGFGLIDGAPANRGMLDQIEALRWVQRNIAAFGGDPDRVTIGGQSAGGGSVMALLVSPPARGLFHGAIAHSPALPAPTADRARELTARMAEILEVEPTVDGFASVSEEQVLDAQDVLEAELARPASSPEQVMADLVASGGMSLAFLPCLDEQVLPFGVSDALAAGQDADVPLLAGTTAHEFTFIGTFVEPTLQGADPIALLRSHALGDLTDDLVAANPGFDPALHLGQLITTLTFRAPTARWAELRGQRPTWLYDFRQHPEGGLAVHCAELPYVFDCLAADGVEAACGANPPQKLADAAHATWVRFISTGGLGEKTADTGGVLVFDGSELHEEPGYEFERSVAERLGL